MCIFLPISSRQIPLKYTFLFRTFAGSTVLEFFKLREQYQESIGGAVEQFIRLNGYETLKVFHARYFSLIRRNSWFSGPELCIRTHPRLL